MQSIGLSLPGLSIYNNSTSSADSQILRYRGCVFDVFWRAAIVDFKIDTPMRLTCLHGHERCSWSLDL
jgi:hypothetical protein